MAQALSGIDLPQAAGRLILAALSALLPYILGVLGAAIIIVLLHLADKYILHPPPRLYPASHAQALERVHRVIDLIAAQPFHFPMTRSSRS